MSHVEFQQQDVSSIEGCDDQYVKGGSIGTAADRMEGSTLYNSDDDTQFGGAMTESTLSMTKSSILKNSIAYTPRVRSDSKGQKIKKFGKQHSIAFDTELLNIHEVENWKEYNKIDEEEGKEEQCNCWII